MDYYNKYLKYKIKYTELSKKNMRGGVTKMDVITLDNFTIVNNLISCININSISSLLIKNFTPENMGTVTHLIDTTSYNKIYFTSDLQSDLRRFVQILLSSGLIQYKILPPHKNYYFDGDMIYCKDLYDVSNMIWVNSNTILILLGDLVSGKYRGVNVNDTRGLFEILIHILIYNIRILAKEKESKILFIIGNHDNFSVLYDHPDRSINDFYQQYIADNTIKFYHGQNPDNPILQRKTFLSLFYKYSFFYYIQLVRGVHIIASCVHGSFHSQKTGICLLNEDLFNLQNYINTHIFDKNFKIDMNMSNNRLTLYDKKIADYLALTIEDTSGHNSIIEAEYIELMDPSLYTLDKSTGSHRMNNKDYMCKKLNETSNLTGLIIVGHRTTTSSKNTIDEIINDSIKYNGCKSSIMNTDLTKKNCIVSSCNLVGTNLPLLTFVDVALPDIFNMEYKKTFENRKYEILVLELKEESSQLQVKNAIDYIDKLYRVEI